VRAVSKQPSRHPHRGRIAEKLPVSNRQAWPFAVFSITEGVRREKHVPTEKELAAWVPDGSVLLGLAITEDDAISALT